MSASADISAQWYDEQPAPAATASFIATPATLPPIEQLAASARWAALQPNPVVALQGSAQRSVFNMSRETILLNVEQEQGARWARHASANACSFCRLMATRGAVYTSAAAATTVVGRGVDLSVADKRAIAAGQMTRDEALAARRLYRDPRKAKAAGAQVGDERVSLGKTRGTRKLGERYHDHCHCVAVAVRPGDTYEPPAYVEQWSEDYDRAVDAAKAAGKTKGEYGAIDLKAVLREMDGQQREQRKTVGEWLDAENRHKAAVLDWLDAEDEHKHAVEYYSRPDALAEAIGDPPPKPKTARKPKRTVDDALADMQAAVAAGDYDAIDKFAAEAEKLEARDNAAAAKKAAKEAAKSAAEQAKIDRMLELIDREGWHPDEAEAEAYGISVEKVRRQNFIRNARADGHVGRGFDELIGWKHQELAAEAYFEAEAATNGRMLKRKYEGAGTADARQLWTMSDAKVREVASEEMLAWFDQHGRLTRQALRAAVLDGTTLWRNPMGEDYLQ